MANAFENLDLESLLVDLDAIKASDHRLARDAGLGANKYQTNIRDGETHVSKHDDIDDWD